MNCKLNIYTRLCFLGVVLLFANCMFAQSIEQFYVGMPDELCPTLSKQNRQELLEYYKTGNGDSIANRYGKSAHLLELDTLNNHIYVANTPTSTFEMKLVKPQNETPFLIVVHTVCGTICHSNVEFYDTSWARIYRKLSVPKAIDWIKKDALATIDNDIEWVKRVLETSFVSIRLAAKSNTMAAKNNTLSFLSKEDREIIQPLVEDKDIIITLDAFQITK